MVCCRLRHGSYDHGLRDGRRVWQARFGVAPLPLALCSVVARLGMPLEHQALLDELPTKGVQPVHVPADRLHGVLRQLARLARGGRGRPRGAELADVGEKLVRVAHVRLRHARRRRQALVQLQRACARRLGDEHARRIDHGRAVLPALEARPVVALRAGRAAADLKLGRGLLELRRAGRCGDGGGCGGHRIDQVGLLAGQAVQLAQLPPEGRIPPVLDLVVGAAFNRLGDVGPSVAHRAVRLDELQVLFLGPLALVDHRVQMVMPSLAALLAGATRGEVRRD
mmetsp:Transcript_29657/g.94377  ORF Transcript_29657/g.94377 Transcript_29657/m.94377 type:complete len:282 (-) Transcript_29657:158-1003(-)